MKPALAFAGLRFVLLNLNSGSWMVCFVIQCQGGTDRKTQSLGF
jgi:hypothetical protein